MVPVPRELGMNTNRVEYRAHKPVLVEEVLNLLEDLSSGALIDATYGSGGHFNLIKSTYSKFQLYGIDRDREAVQSATDGDLVYKYDFSEIDQFTKENQIKDIKCILFDFGVSTHQLMSQDRGFSFQYDSDLDMRMDRDQLFSAKDFVNTASKEELYTILKTYGEEPHSKKVGDKIIDSRPVDSSKELAELIGAAVPSSNPIVIKKSIRRCFQAIRIHINGELEQINEGVIKSINLIDSGGIIVTISYHSLEDKIVKKIFHEYSLDCICPKEFPKCTCNQIPTLKLVSPKKIKPKDLEINKNRKSKSAILRFAVKI